MARPDGAMVELKLLGHVARMNRRITDYVINSCRHPVRHLSFFREGKVEKLDRAKRAGWVRLDCWLLARARVETRR